MEYALSNAHLVLAVHLQLDCDIALTGDFAVALQLVSTLPGGSSTYKETCERSYVMWLLQQKSMKQDFEPLGCLSLLFFV